MAVTLYGKGEGWFETSPYGVMADRYGSEPGGGGLGYPAALTAILRLAHNRKDRQKRSSHGGKRAGSVAVALPSPDKSREGWYLSLFFVEFSVCLGLLFWQEVFNNTDDGWLETVVAIARGMEPLVIVLTAATVIIVEDTRC